MNQNVWGPPMWLFLHTTTFNYPLQPTQEEKDRYKSFFYELQHILPCKYCRNNYRRNLKETPIRLYSRKDMVEWLIDLHNEVNLQNGKRPYTYDEVIKMYETMFKKQLILTSADQPRIVETSDYSTITVVVISLLLIATYLLWRRY